MLGCWQAIDVSEAGSAFSTRWTSSAGCNSSTGCIWSSGSVSLCQLRLSLYCWLGGSQCPCQKLTGLNYWSFKRIIVKRAATRSVLLSTKNNNDFLTTLNTMFYKLTFGSVRWLLQELSQCELLVYEITLILGDDCVPLSLSKRLSSGSWYVNRLGLVVSSLWVFSFFGKI